MSDITKCHGVGCEKKSKCYRYVSESDDLYQSYFATSPYKSDGSCEYYWETKDIDKKTWDYIYLSWIKSTSKFDLSNFIQYLKDNYNIPTKIKRNGNKEKEKKV